MSIAFALEKEVAVAAVLRACSLTSSVFNKLVKNEKLTKDDKSPVTVADFSAQAVVSTMLAKAFPDDPLVGEEDTADLRANPAMRDRVVELANEALTADLAMGDNVQWGIGPGQTRTAEELLSAIDRGTYEGGSSGRMWTVDPIDGTKGFLRGEQYAVCLAFLVDAQVQVGVMGCPNLPVDISNPEGQKGCLFVAVRGQGAEQRTISNAKPVPLSIPKFEDSKIAMLESVEKAHSALDVNERVAKILGLTRPPIRMDSQAKYCSLARGDGSIYLRLPVGTGYQEKIWDHAPGSILVEEAGGIITDSKGEPLDFGRGRTMGVNYGVVATGRDIHPRVISAIKQTQEVDTSSEGKL